MTKTNQRIWHPAIPVEWLIFPDLHLGSIFSNHETVMNVLSTVRCNRILFPGDLMHRNRLLPLAIPVLKILRELADAGVEMIATGGDHDAEIANFIAEEYLGCTATDEAYLETLGLKGVMLHGHKFEPKVSLATGLAGVSVYYLGLHFDKAVNLFRPADRAISASAWVKTKFGPLSRHVEEFRENMIQYGHSRGFNMVIGAHKHARTAIIRDGVFFFDAGTAMGTPFSFGVKTFEGDFLSVVWNQNGFVPEQTIEMSGEELRTLAKSKRGYEEDLVAVC